MKNLIVLSFILSSIIVVVSCKGECKECTGGKTLSNTTLCEEDFEKTSNYNDQVRNYESDGCTCKIK